MFDDTNKAATSVIIHTGNILNINEVKKKPGQNPTEELLESVRTALSDPLKSYDGDALHLYSKERVYTTEPAFTPSELTTSVKVFLEPGQATALEEAVDKLLPYLEIASIDSLVFSCSGGYPIILQHWRALEAMAEAGKVARIGISDIDTDLFIALYGEASVKPSIVQINLASCCVVPPQLQDFAKLHEVQLLTHNDPKELLPDSKLRTVCDGVEGLTTWWTARFQVHVKCRGVLATKGYLLRLGRST